MIFPATSRRAVALFLAGCLPLAEARSQGETSVKLGSAIVVTDSKGTPTAVRVEFEVSTAQIVHEVKLSFRKFGDADYSELKLKLNPELLYEGSVLYAERIEYFLTIVSEKGAVSAVGSTTSPRLLACEDLPRVKKSGHHIAKFAAYVGVAVIGAALAAIFGAREVLSKRKHR